MTHYEQLCKVSKELQSAQEQIKALEGTIASLKEPCHKCVILEEEAKNMISSIKCLEEEIKTLKQPSSIPAAGSDINLAVHNRFDVLQKSDDPNYDSDFTFVSKKRKQKEKRKKTVSVEKKVLWKNNFSKKSRVGEDVAQIKVPFNELTIVGDSHVRNLTALMTPMIHPSTSVSGMCKPGAGLSNIAPTAPPPAGNCYVLMAGTNDVANGREAYLLSHIEEVIQRCLASSRLLIVPLTPRHDLPLNSPIHRTVNLVNDFMVDICRRYEGVNVLDISGIGRHHHTSHGLHLRASGKRDSLIVERLALMRPLRCPSAPSTSTSTPAQPITQEYESYADAVLRRSPTPYQKTSVVTHTSSQTVFAVNQQTDTLHNKTDDTIFLGTPP